MANGYYTGQHTQDHTAVDAHSRSEPCCGSHDFRLSEMFFLICSSPKCNVVFKEPQRCHTFSVIFSLQFPLGELVYSFLNELFILAGKGSHSTPLWLTLTEPLLTDCVLVGISRTILPGVLRLPQCRG